MGKMKTLIKNVFNRALGYTATRHQRRLLKDWRMNGKYLEIGVWRGDFSAQIYKVCRPDELHLLDPWEFQPKFKHRMFGGAGAKDQNGWTRFLILLSTVFFGLPNVYHRGYSDDMCNKF